MKDKKYLNQFRLITILEGISYLVLLLIAMPLKYLANQPEYVSWVGRIHGGFVIAFLALLFICIKKYNWDSKFALKGFLYSLIPFGAFIFDKELRVQE